MFLLFFAKIYQFFAKRFTIAENYEKPIYPNVSTGDSGSVLQIFALASKEAKKELGRMILPATTEAMRRRYMKAKKILEVKKR